MTKKTILELKNVTKYYDDELIFDNINLELKKGDVISLIGKNGCGKSTLLKCLNRLESISSGSIIFNGQNINDIPLIELRQKIGIVFQDYTLFEHLSILDNLTIGLIKIKKYTKEEATKKAIDILTKIDLVEKKDKYPDELSGGQKQRVAIARTLLMEPDIILLDEPTSALDKEMTAGVLSLINELIKKDMTLIIVSHEEEFVRKVSDHIYKIVNKNIEEVKL